MNNFNFLLAVYMIFISTIILSMILIKNEV